MADNPRIEELRRRVEGDPASIAFAQLAEEHRRAGEYDEAIRVCRSGLAQYPGYLSARVTLGRAILETGQFDEAQSELEQVVSVAPDRRGRRLLYGCNECCKVPTAGADGAAATSRRPAEGRSARMASARMAT